MSTRNPTEVPGDTHSAVDPPAASPPAEVGTALRGADAALRAVIGVAWIAVALRADSAIGMAVLVGFTVPALLGTAPLAVTAAGSALAAWIAVPTWSVGAAIAVIALGALRLRIHLGGASGWLRDVRRLERRRAAALLATGFARARPDAIALAGDRYEYEGRLRAELIARGARPAGALARFGDTGLHLGRALAGWPGLLAAIERAALRWTK